MQALIFGPRGSMAHLREDSMLQTDSKRAFTLEIV